MNSMPLDAIDRRLLNLLQVDSDRTIRALAMELGVSAPTCLRRIRRLKKAKLLLGSCAQIDPVRAGFSVQAIFEIKLHQSGGPALRRFESRMRTQGPVAQCFEVAGQLDYLVTVIARDMEDLAGFIERALASDENIASFRTHIVLRRVIDRRTLPIRDDD